MMTEEIRDEGRTEDVPVAQSVPQDNDKFEADFDDMVKHVVNGMNSMGWKIVLAGAIPWIFATIWGSLALWFGPEYLEYINFGPTAEQILEVEDSAPKLHEEKGVSAKVDLPPPATTADPKSAANDKSTGAGKIGGIPLDQIGGKEEPTKAAGSPPGEPAEAPRPPDTNSTKVEGVFANPITMALDSLGVRR